MIGISFEVIHQKGKECAIKLKDHDIETFPEEMTPEQIEIERKFADYVKGVVYFSINPQTFKSFIEYTKKIEGRLCQQ